MPHHLPLYLAIFGDVLIGRAGEDDPPDIDLTTFGGQMMGVSRQHAILRPDRDGLRLVDLDSTNGTYHNQQRLQSGQVALLHDGDTICFGQLRFTLNMFA